MSTPVDLEKLADRIAVELLNDLRLRKGFDELFKSFGTDTTNGIHRTWVILVKDLLPDGNALQGTSARDRLPESYVDGRTSRPVPRAPEEVLEDL